MFAASWVVLKSCDHVCSHQQRLSQHSGHGLVLSSHRLLQVPTWSAVAFIMLDSANSGQ